MLKKDGKKEIDMTAIVLTTGYWPHYPPIEINLPAQVYTNLIYLFFFNIYNY